MVCQLGYCTCHIIVIEGIDGVGAQQLPSTAGTRAPWWHIPHLLAPRTGKSTLVNQLQSKLCQAYVNVSLVEPVDKNSSPEVRHAIAP